MEVFSEEHLKIVAKIIGEHSAAQQALDNIEERRKQGQDPICFLKDRSYIVIDRKVLEQEGLSHVESTTRKTD